MSRPKLTVGVPTYKRPILLERTLRSFLGGDLGAVEIIVSDDSPQQEAKEVVDKLATEFEQEVKYLTITLPASMPSAEQLGNNLNNIICNASGEFIYIIHDDDYMTPKGMQSVLSALATNANSYPVLRFGVDIVNLSEKVLKNYTVSRPKFLEPEQAITAIFGDSSFIRFPSMVIESSVYKKVGMFNPKRKAPLDLDMWLRAVDCFGMQLEPATISAYTIHEDAITMKMFNLDNLEIHRSIFNESIKTTAIPEKHLRRLNATYLTKWILAGAYRSLKNNSWDNGRKIMGLFRSDYMKSLPFTFKRFGIRLALHAITFTR